MFQLFKSCGGLSIVCPDVRTEGKRNMMLTSYLDKLDLGVDAETGLPNLLVGSASEYHELPEESKKRAWALVATATKLLNLGPVRIYQLASEGKLGSKTLKKNPNDRKGLKFIKLHNQIVDQAQVRQADKTRVIRRLKRAMRTAWWLNEQAETFLTFIVAHELNRVEMEEFGTPGEQRDALIERYKNLRWLADIALTPIKDKFGPEEAARLVNTHVSKYSSNYQHTKEGTTGHEGN